VTGLRRAVAVAREALLFELALYRSLARWVVRRPDVPAHARSIGYAALVGPMLWLWIFGSAVEVVVVEVVLRSIEAPWAEALRLPLLVLGVWGVLWMLGMLAAYRTRPHLLTDTELLLRSGARSWVAVPLALVGAVRTVGHELPGLRSLQVQHQLVLIGVSSGTNLELVLEEPATLRTSKGLVPAARVGIWVDDPRAVAALLGSRIAARR
jgi:hypothetical protein